MAQRLLFAAALCLLAACARSGNSQHPLPPPTIHVASHSPGGGGPRLVWALSRAPALPAGWAREDAARAHLSSLASALGQDDASFDHFTPRFVRDLGRGSITVAMRQSVDGVEVFPGDVRLLMRRDGSLVAASGALRPPRGEAVAFALDAPTAAAHALAARFRAPATSFELQTASSSSDGSLRLALTPASAAATGVELTRPLFVKPVLFRQGATLTPAFLVELVARRSGMADRIAHRYFIAADDGRVLADRDLIVHDAFQYRVWASPTGDLCPFDGPHEDFTPHPTGVPDGSEPAFVMPGLVTVEGLNHNPQGQPDPWLPPGATETRGNNVDAYADFNEPDGFSDGDVRATVTSPGAFDRVYDTSKDPGASIDQRKAGVTSAFYISNWLHDFLYDSGFDEAAGNAQLNNYGRGGIEGDPLLVSAQRYKGTNNAFMVIAFDGNSPELVLLNWRGPVRTSLTLTPVGLSPRVGTAGFGPADFDVQGQVVLANDGEGNPTDACEDLTGDYTGRVVLVDRGDCPFLTQARNVEAAGGAAVLIADNVPADSPPDLGSGEGVKIGAFGITLEDGEAIKASLGGEVVSARLLRKRDPNRDPSLDKGVVAHEYGHLLHHRLTICLLTPQCNAISEGIADFVALLVTLRPEDMDRLDGTYAPSAYSAGRNLNSSYFGVRRFPYSVDFSRNALTFRHVITGEPLPDTPINPGPQDNAERHNAGEIVASALFEVYVALLEDARDTGRRDFFQTRRAMADYLVAGLQLAPDNATFLETRDGLLAAIHAGEDARDLERAAQAFARRGFGTCARDPADPSDPTFAGIVESFDAVPALAFGPARLDDSVQSCDQDGFLDAREEGVLTLEVRNVSPVAASDVEVRAATEAPGFEFVERPVQTIDSIPPFGVATIRFPVRAGEVGPTASLSALLWLTARVQPGCGDAVARFSLPYNRDQRKYGATVDGFEADDGLWRAPGNMVDGIWSRKVDEAGGHYWHAANLAFFSDESLFSPRMKVSGSEPFRIRIRHRFSFHVSDQGYHDGGVVELRVNGGNWYDVTRWAAIAYTGAVPEERNSPLRGREAFVGANPSWPAYDEVVVDFGDRLAGVSVEMRFRVATDEKGAAEGWDVDEVAFEGLADKPFTHIFPDRDRCRPDAGEAPDAAVEPPPAAPDPGCGCGTSAAPAGSALAGALALALLGRRRVRKAA